MLIQDDGAQKYLQSFPGAFEPLDDKIDMSQFAPYKVAAATRRRQVLLAALRLGRHRPLLSLRLFRGSRLHRCGPAGHHLGPAHRDRQDGQGKDRPPLLGIDLNDVGCDPHDAAVGRQVVLQRPTAALNHRRQPALQGGARDLRQALDQPASASPSPAGPNIPAPSPRAKSPRSDRRVDRPAPSRPTPTSAGKWAVAPVPRLDIEGSANASNLGGSSWYVLASSPAERRPRPSTSSRPIWGEDIDFYQKILVEPGRRRLAARRSRRRGLQGERRVLRRPARLAELLRPGSAKVPAVDYGIFTAEVDCRDLGAAAGHRPGRRSRRCHRGDQRAGQAADAVRLDGSGRHPASSSRRRTGVAVLGFGLHAELRDGA